jgi:hypothetical protein
VNGSSGKAERESESERGTGEDKSDGKHKQALFASIGHSMLSLK